MTAAALLALLALTDGGSPEAQVAAPSPASDAGATMAPLTRAPSLNLLVGLPAPVVDKVKNVERMTDGEAPEPGENWNSQWTSIIEKDGSIIWDFGLPTDFDGVWIQADNNDIYTVATSDDGRTFATVWDSLTVDAPGMQARTASAAHGHGRFVKLTAKGGDGSYSVGEFALFKDGAQAKPYLPRYMRVVTQAPPPFDGNWVVVAVVLFGVVFLVRQMKPKDTRTDPTDSPPKQQ